MVRFAKKYLILIPVLFLATVLMLPSRVIAITEGSSFGIENPLKVGTVVDLLKAFVGILVQIGFPLAVLAFIYTGFLFVTAFGNEEKITKAKSALNWVFIGTAVLLGAYIIITAIENTIKLLQ